MALNSSDDDDEEDDENSDDEDEEESEGEDSDSGEEEEDEDSAFPESLVRRYTFDIIEGLHFLHSKRFIHRDIKPTNLLISHGVVKLGDFGCSTSGAVDGEEEN
eukprot:gene39702-49058_t